MNLRTGIQVVVQQYRGLAKKNLLVAWRKKRATFVRVFSSLLFMLGIQQAMDARSNSSSSNSYPLVSPPIPPRESKHHLKLPCFDFVWSGNDSATIRTIVASIKANNPQRPIPSTKVKGFRTKDEVNAWLFSNPMRSPGALHFREIHATVIGHGIQTNSTPVAFGGHYGDPTFKFQVPLQIAAEREIARSLIGVPNFSWVVAFKEFSHPALEDSGSLVAFFAPYFFLAIAMFGFVFQITSLVTKKELKLRQAMTMTGLYDCAYWLSWLTWEGILILISSVFIVIFGNVFRFDIFLKNSLLVVFLVFLLFQLNMVGFVFFLSAFISKSSSSTTVGFSVFIVGSVTQARVCLFNFTRNGVIIRTICISPQGSVGISWSRRAECAPNDAGCTITINDIYMWLVATFFLWFVLAIYLDNVFPNVIGVRKSLLYFLKPGYWTGKGGNKVEEGGLCSCIRSLPTVEHITPDDEDVLEEENVVKEQTREGMVHPNVAVQIRGLVKTYPGSKTIGCCKCQKTSPYHAVKVK